METVACNLCGSTRHRFVYEMPDIQYFPEEFFKIVECVDCGLGFVNPRPTLAEMQKYYPPAYYRIFASHLRRNSKRYRRQARYLESIEKSPGSKKLLDLGCAEGDFPRYMMSRGWSVEGVEISICTKPFTDFKVHKQQFHEIPDFEIRYDAVTAWAVLEHVHDPMAYFRKAGEIVRRGGLFVFLVQEFHSLASRRLFCEDVPRHLYFFTQSTAKEFLQKAGFELTTCVYDNHCYAMVSVNWLRFFLQTKLRRRPFRFEDRHPTRIEYLYRKRLEPGFASTLKYMIAFPGAVLEQALMPLLTRIQILRGTFGTCIYVATKK